jgi:hypothetical protein|tara:strand:+ start:1089 stop:1295 length:207 start_codon:yes stop_codon:yes gene_type:complete
MTPEQKKRARKEGGDITKPTPRQMKRLEKIAKDQKEEREKKKGVRMRDVDAELADNKATLIKRKRKRK